jgi:hypothetical protein
MNLPYDASRQKEHCSPRPDFDAPERTPRNVLWIQQFRSWQSHDLPVMITSEDCGQIADAFEAADQRIAALEQERDEAWYTAGRDPANSAYPLCSKCTATARAGGKLLQAQREWEADGKP